MLSNAEVQSLNERFVSANLEDILGWAWRTFGTRAAIGTSFQGAGLVIMHTATRQQLAFPIFTLDTGLLFPETLALRQRLETFLNCRIESLTPDLTVEQQAEALGPELWKRDPDLCCTARKVVPLQARLASLDCWITGLRREQSDARTSTRVVEVHTLEDQSGREIVKLNPMAHWTRDAVWDYLKRHGVPYNPLHDRGYRSIGCQPCTALEAAGGSERAGRWMGFQKSECGIHTFSARKA